MSKRRELQEKWKNIQKYRREAKIVKKLVRQPGVGPRLPVRKILP